MGTKNDPGVYDCHAKADPDEPMFTLLARDPNASTLVRQWAVARELRDGGPTDKSTEAFACAVAMDAWRDAHR